MKAWVRSSSRRARSCQETESAVALILSGASLSDGSRGAGTDDLTRLAPDVAEAVRELTGEIVGFARPEHARRTADGELDAPADHDPGLLAAMREHLLAGGGAGRVALVQYRELPAGTLCRDQPQRYLGIAELDELARAEERLWRSAQFEGEELRQRHRYAVQHLLQ